MAHPKRRHSHSRTKKRQTHYRIDSPALVVCRECGNLKPPHRICPFCGYYRSTLVRKPEKEKKKKR